MAEVRVRSAFALGHTATEPPQPLRESLKRLCPQAPRRLNRFTELALLGAVDCANRAGIALPPDCAVFLATSQGYAEDVSRLLEAMLLHAQAPMPVEFINVSGSSAGFYLGQVLGLNGRSVATAAGAVSFEAALELAWTALAARPGLALVGGVDDAAYPLAAHRARLGLTEAEPVAEVSSWLLLDSRPEAQGVLLAEPEFAPSFAQAQASLAGLDGRVSLGSGLSGAERAALTDARTLKVPELGKADTLSAYLIADALARQPEQSLHHLNGDGVGGYYLLRFVAEGA